MKGIMKKVVKTLDGDLDRVYFEATLKKRSHTFPVFIKGVISPCGQDDAWKPCEGGWYVQKWKKD